MPGSSAQPPGPLVFLHLMMRCEGPDAVSPLLMTAASPPERKLLESGTRSAPANAVPPLAASKAPASIPVDIHDLRTMIASMRECPVLGREGRGRGSVTPDTLRVSGCLVVSRSHPGRTRAASDAP